MITTEKQKVLLLGSNIQPEYHLPQAIERLNQHFRIQKISNIWETPAVGSDGPGFLNAAVLLETGLSPQSLKTFVLRPIEAELGRVRQADKNAPRTIDLDVVVWGLRTWDADIWRYAHAAVPVAELVPNLRNHPLQDPLAQVARKLQGQTKMRWRSDISQRVRPLVFGTLFRGEKVGVMPGEIGRLPASLDI